MGFEFELVKRALASSNQNVEQALEMLLSGAVAAQPMEVNITIE